MLSPLLENEDDTASIRLTFLADELSIESSIDDCDYDNGLVSLDETLMSASQSISSMDIFRISCVVVMTLGGISANLTASIKVLTASAMTMTSSEWMVVIAGITCLASSSVVWRGEVQTRLYPPVETLRLVNRELRAYSHRLKEELRALKREHELLITEVDRLQHCEILLEEAVTECNGDSVDKFIELVRENQLILRQRKDNILQSIIQDVVKLVLKSDLDRDGYLNNKERDILGKRLSISMELYGIVFDIDKFLLAVERHPSISGALTIVRHLLPIDDNDKKRLLVSSFRDSININFDNVNNANSKSMEDDVYDMFYTPISDDVHRGDAHSIGMCKEYHARNNGQLPLLISISPTMSNSILGLRCSVSSGGVKHHLISTPKVIMNSHHHHHHHFLQHHSPSRCRRKMWKVLREAVISGRVTKISAMTSSKMIPSSNDLEKTAVLIGNKNKQDPWDEESQ